MSLDEILQRELNPQQRAVVQDRADTILCLACAGSGKTRTLSYRAARLLVDGEDARSIVAFTFTEKAAESIKLQVAKALENAGLRPTLVGAMFIGTIHSYCQIVLGEMDARYRQFDILDENRLKLYLISRFAQLGLPALMQARRVRYFEVIKEVANAWKTMNDEMVSLTDVSTADLILGGVLLNLQTRLDHDEYIDFSLMIRLVVEGLARGDAGAHRAIADLRHLMVDEYQDVNPAQEALIQHLRAHCNTLAVVGDDDQAIYAWRGADVQNILNFGQRFPGASQHTLAHNYRSSDAIVASADALAAAELGARRIAKNPTAANAPGPRQMGRFFFHTRADEAAFVAERIDQLLGTAYQERNGQVRGLTPGDFAILMRSTRGREQDGSARHSAFTQELLGRHIPYSLEAGGGPFERPQVEALRAAFELLRAGSPTREVARQFFDDVIVASHPHADFEAFANVLAEWGRLIHEPRDGVRRRVYPQRLVHQLLHAFGIQRTTFDAGTMRDLGVFSRIIQDVETVYLSIDSPGRFAEILNFLKNVAESGYDTATDDVLRRPDTVTVSTVHKMKGLEFPVVFVVDVEAGRFPLPQKQYAGWLPPNVIANALARGAYQSTRFEEARLFYTAITRAERYLYVTGSEQLPGANQARRQSPFALRLTHGELIIDPTLLPNGLAPAARARRVDEVVVPTSFSDIRYYLRCPRDYQLRKSFGFTPAITEMFGFGKTIHTAITKLHETFRDHPPTPQQARTVAEETFHLKHVAQSRDPINRPGAYERARESAMDVAERYATDYGDDFLWRRQVELRFEVPVRNAVVSGAIDLILRVDERGNVVEATVIDFKAMEGGADPETNERLQWTELALQVQLYAKAARDVLGENARTGAVHLLKDGQRVAVPVTDEAITAAVENVEWAVQRILAGDFPMRPHTDKCEECDFRLLCPAQAERFADEVEPAAFYVPGDPPRRTARAFSQFQARS